jgi:hypothetical protein
VHNAFRVNTKALHISCAVLYCCTSKLIYYKFGSNDFDQLQGKIQSIESDDTLFQFVMTPFTASESTIQVSELSSLYSGIEGTTIPDGYNAGVTRMAWYNFESSPFFSSTIEENVFFNIGLFDSPAPQKITLRVDEFSTGNVRVIRRGGGFGESSIAATHFLSSNSKG